MVNLTVWISKNLARDDLGLQKNEVIWSDKCTDVRLSCYSSVQLSNFLKIQSVIEKTAYCEINIYMLNFHSVYINRDSLMTCIVY